MNHRRIKGDCLEVMRDLPRAHYDLLLTDPPYAKPSTYEAGLVGAKRRWSDFSVLSGWWRYFMIQAMPLMKQDSCIAAFANASALAAIYPVFYEACKLLQVVTWDKVDMGPGRPFRRQSEFVIVGTLGAWIGRDGDARDVIAARRVPSNKRVHPAQKPRDLLIALARQLCPDAGRVLDPFAGSFSTEAACDSLGLECTSIEWGEAFAMPDEQQRLAV